MQRLGFTENDWKLFSNKIAAWQESYMSSLIQDYIELLSEDVDSSEKFWKLEQRIRIDKKKAGVKIQMKRSKLIDNIILLITEDVINMEELDGFSDELKETIRTYIK